MKRISNNIFSKIFICFLALSSLVACRDNSATSSLHIDKGYSLSTPHKAKRNVDGALVAIADGGGAFLGVSLGKYCPNPYFVVAYAIGIGAMHHGLNMRGRKMK